MRKDELVNASEHLPRVIHFVWAGGERIMPFEQRKAVIKWAKANPLKAN